MIIKKILFVIMVLIAFSACAQKMSPSSATHNDPVPFDAKKMEQDIFNFINEYRISIGLVKLQILKEATTEAVGHSTNMANGVTAFGHDGFDARMDRITDKAGFMHAMAENVAAGYLTARQVVDGWLNSPGHKKNIEGDHTLTGIGVVQNKEGYIYYTQIFLRQ